MQQVKLQELSYYELYLLNYLKEYHPEKVDDIDFIKERSDNAAILFEKSRLDGKTVMNAQEIAMKELMRGLHFSKHYLILTIIKDEFEKEVPDDKVLLLIKKMESNFNSIFAKYTLSDDFEQSSNYHSLYIELTGEITLYLEKYGI
ncbi:DUF1896 family protein [Bacteroides fragilis]|uniref:DUF1896 family protein n=1 Tax=Bacteroides fragilis TaxID=817 RepID=UPI0022AACAB7|nr:DUF1896 family protein [Bacteroides fragilis]MCZ2660844.1 DUF1896 family protein [Bacteroides fragilis]